MWTKFQAFFPMCMPRDTRAKLHITTKTKAFDIEKLQIVVGKNSWQYASLSCRSSTLPTQNASLPIVTGHVIREVDLGRNICTFIL